MDIKMNIDDIDLSISLNPEEQELIYKVLAQDLENYMHHVAEEERNTRDWAVDIDDVAKELMEISKLITMVEIANRVMQIYTDGERVILGKVYIKAWHRYKIIFFAEKVPTKDGIYYVGFYRNAKGEWENDYELTGRILDIEAEIKKKDEYIWQKALRKLWADPVFQLMKDVLFV